MITISLKSKKIYAFFILFTLSLSQIGNVVSSSTINSFITLNDEIQKNSLTFTEETQLPEKQAFTSYIEEVNVSYIIPSPESFTSPDVLGSSNIIGPADGLYLTFSHTVAPIEYALLKLDKVIVSDTLTLKNFEDYGDISSLFTVYGWSDPYTTPSIDSVNETYIDEGFTPLGLNDVFNGDITLSYENISLEYLLLYDESAVIAPTNIDAIEVYGFTSFIADANKDEIPDIWEYADMNLTQIKEDIDLHGYTYEIMSLVGTAPLGSTNLAFLQPFIQIGILDELDVQEDHFYIVTQTELKLPFPTTYDYLQFLHSHDLVNMTFIESNITVYNELLPAFDKYFGQDQRIRTWQVVDYNVNGNYNPINYQETSGQIGGKYDTLDKKTYTTDTAQEKFDLDVSIVLDIVENVLDAVQGGKDLVEQFMGKIIGFIQGKVMDGVGKALLAKITKKALKSALKAVLSITTIKDIVVKGAKILEKLGLSLPSWLKKILDFVESIPFIDPPVEIWKVRLTFLDETSGLPILGYDFNTDSPIYTHPQGIYFGDTYSAQVILSSRDIFPVIGRIQSKNASRTLTGNLFVEDLGLLESTYARASLDPDEHAQGRVYAIPPDGSIVISQCQINVFTTLSSTIEADSEVTINFDVTDENGTLLTDINSVRAAVNNLPGPMIEIDSFVQLSGNFEFKMLPTTRGLTISDYHMVAILYKTNNIFHDYWNHTFVLQDTIAPAIENVTAVLDKEGENIYFSAQVTDYNLNSSDVVIKLMADSSDMTSANSYFMTSNGTHFTFVSSAAEYSKQTLYYQVIATDTFDNVGSSAVVSIDIPKLANGFVILSVLLPLLVIGIAFRRRKINHELNI